MKAIAMLLIVCAACRGDDIELYPNVNPGGGGLSGGFGTGTDASSGDGDSGVPISGKVCLITDARSPTTNCAASGAGDLTVTLGTRMATTMADGSFTIFVNTGSSNVWRVTGTGIVASAMTFGGGNNIPALTTQVYTDMISANPTAAVPAGSGSIIAKLSNSGGALVGATATTAPPTAGAVLYDGADNVNWSTTSTGTLGVVWAPGITPGTTTSMTVTTALQVQQQLTGIPVFADTITYVFANVP